MGIYESLGVRRLINAYGHYTMYGGSLMTETVRRAMDEAAQWYVDIFELQRQVGQRLASLTRNEAAYVCNGAAGGLFLATLACMTGPDLKPVLYTPTSRGQRKEVVVHRLHRTTLDAAVELAGATFVEIGNIMRTNSWELEAAITERTIAVLYVAGEFFRQGTLSLQETISIAHAHNIPVIVDAAAQLPPVDNLWHFTLGLGADLAIFSGGKDLRGPQTSGLIVGRAPLVEACFANGTPHTHLGRPMKIGKEEIVGLLVAVEEYLHQDQHTRSATFEAIVQFWMEALNGQQGIVVRRVFPNAYGQPVPRILIEVDSALAGLNAAELQQRLWDSNPRIAVKRANGDQGIYITPDTLEPREERLIVERLKQILEQALKTLKLEDESCGA